MVYILVKLSDSLKNAFKMASEDPQQNIAKKYQKHEVFRILQRFPRPLQFIIVIFGGHFSIDSFFKALSFILVTRHLQVQKHEKIGLNILYVLQDQKLSSWLMLIPWALGGAAAAGNRCQMALQTFNQKSGIREHRCHRRLDQQYLKTRFF